MKFITSLFAFIVASAIYTKVSAVDAEYLASIKCQNELEKYLECLTNPKIYTVEQVCPKIQSERCQQFYNDPLNYVTTCKEDPFTTKMLNPIIMNNINNFNLLACQKDEAGNPCPFSELTIMEFSDLDDKPMTDEELKKAKENTCKSKICRDVTYKAYSNIRAAKEYFDKEIAIGNVKGTKLAQREEIAKYLDSEECKAMSNSNVNQENTINNDAKQGNTINDTKQNNTSDENKENNSDATTLKAVNGIFITLCLLLLTYY